MEFANWDRRRWHENPPGYVCFPFALSLIAAHGYGSDFWEMPLSERLLVQGPYAESAEAALRYLRRAMIQGHLIATANVFGLMKDIPAAFWNNEPGLVRETLSLCHVPFPVGRAPRQTPHDSWLFISAERLAAYCEAVSAAQPASDPDTPPAPPANAKPWKVDLYRLLARSPDMDLPDIYRAIDPKGLIPEKTIRDAVQRWVNVGGKGRIIRRRQGKHDRQG